MSAILHLRTGTGPQALQMNNLCRGGPNTVNVVAVPQLHIFNLNVNQGASILFVVTASDHVQDKIMYAFLVDGGHTNYANHVKTILGSHPLDALCITHEDADHADAAIQFTNVPIAMRFVPQAGLSRSKPFAGVVPTERTKTQLWPPTNASTLWAGYPTLEIEWLHVWSGHDRLIDDPNSMSLAGIVHWAGFKYYFDGDLDEQRQDRMAFQNFSPLVDCTYVTHHGSKNSTSDLFLGFLQPTVAIISSGSNSFQHPTTVALDRLVKRSTVEYVLLTNCDYNRPQANPNYWSQEVVNFGKMLAADIHGETAENKMKRVEEFGFSLEESLSDMAPDTTHKATHAKLLSDVQNAPTRFETALPGIDLKRVGTLRDLNYLHKTELDELDNLYRAQPQVGNAKVVVAGGHMKKSAIVVTLSGFAPSEYQVSFLDANDQWLFKWFPINTRKMARAANLHLDLGNVYCTPLPNPFYRRSEHAFQCEHFGKSNRRGRNFAAAARYKCVKCNKVIKEQDEVVLFECEPCGGQRSYHAKCLLSRMFTPDNPPDDSPWVKIAERANQDDTKQDVKEPLRFAPDVQLCPVQHAEKRPVRAATIRMMVRRLADTPAGRKPARKPAKVKVVPDRQSKVGISKPKTNKRRTKAKTKTRGRGRTG